MIVMNKTSIEEALRVGVIATYNQKIYKDVKNRWDKLSKPLDALGDFEDIISKIGAILESTVPRTDKITTLVFASDNGIVGRGISQAGQEITAICADAIADMKKSVSVMAMANNIQVKVIDVGVNAVLKSDAVIDKKVRMGSRDFLTEEAMTREEVMMALSAGFDAVYEEKIQGTDVICVGEIGIGNTTTSSAIAAAILKVPAAVVTGRGAGLSDEGLATKIQVIDQGIAKYDLYGKNAFDILKAVGGYDIAALAGAMIGGAVYGMPIILDGMISAAAALVAENLVRGVSNYLIASHSSKESACGRMLSEIGLKPVIDANMALGEGTGAVMMASLIKTANEVLLRCSSFEEDGIEAYTHFDSNK